MGFLDNSGDIILDAVLTNIGRRRMASGNFRITKFALGDDEISYTLYNKAHPSGSAYYDLEILQTPILEAFTGRNTAAINYGLTSYSRNDLLYLPSIKLNEGTFNDRIAKIDSTRKVIYIADNRRRTSAGKTTQQALFTSLGNNGASIINAGDGNSKYAFFEVGILSSELAPTANNQAAFIARPGLMDNNFVVSFDNRFIQTIISAAGASTFTNNTNNGNVLNVSLRESGQILRDRSLENYSETTAPAHPNRMYSDYSNNNTSDTSLQYSVITGPRAVFGAIQPIPRGDLQTAQFKRWGNINQVMISGDSTNQLYDWIDTTVYVRGLTSNTVLQLTFRIVRISDNT